MAPFFVSGPHYRNCPAVGGSISISSHHAIKDLVLVVQIRKRCQYDTPFTPSQYDQAMVSSHFIELTNNNGSIDNDVAHETRDVVDAGVTEACQVVTSFLPDMPNAEASVRAVVAARS